MATHDMQTEKALRICIDWAALEFKNIIAKAESEASTIIIRANLIHEVAMEKNKQAWYLLRSSEEEADQILQQAIEDADHIVLVARETAEAIQQTARNDYYAMVNMFKQRINLLLAECSNCP